MELAGARGQLLGQDLAGEEVGDGPGVPPHLLPGVEDEEQRVLPEAAQEGALRGHHEAAEALAVDLQELALAGRREQANVHPVDPEGRLGDPSRGFNFVRGELSRRRETAAAGAQAAARGVVQVPGDDGEGALACRALDEDVLPREEVAHRKGLVADPHKERPVQGQKDDEGTMRREHRHVHLLVQADAQALRQRPQRPDVLLHHGLPAVALHLGEEALDALPEVDGQVPAHDELPDARALLALSDTQHPQLDHGVCDAADEGGEHNETEEDDADGEGPLPHVLW
mmetsp:Transcript_93722/g.284622  ORF Transcript_93722/g.284622 Transcript_93722/m.284622 type:complete len:285 (+) Transcript_93722:108-962(+)